MASSCLLEFVVRFPVDTRSVIPLFPVHYRIDFSMSPEAYDFSLYRQITKGNDKNYFFCEIFVSEDFVIVENRTTLSCFAISLCTEDAILVDISLTSR